MTNILPRGYRYVLLTIAYLKRAATLPGMSDADRLWMLESLNCDVDECLSREMIAAVEPMSTAETEMVREAMKLDGSNERSDASYKLLVEDATFNLFVGLNAGLRRALEMRATP